MNMEGVEQGDKKEEQIYSGFQVIKPNPKKREKILRSQQKSNDSQHRTRPRQQINADGVAVRPTPPKYRTPAQGKALGGDTVATSSNEVARARRNLYRQKDQERKQKREEAIAREKFIKEKPLMLKKANARAKSEAMEQKSRIQNEDLQSRVRTHWAPPPSGASTSPPQQHLLQPPPSGARRHSRPPPPRQQQQQWRAEAEWEWLDDTAIGPVWVAYSPDISADIEGAFRRGLSRAGFAAGGGGRDGRGAQYAVDLEEMVQENQSTGFARPVRRQVLEFPAAFAAAPGAAARWEVEDGHRGWRAYPPAAAAQLEAALAAGRGRTVLHLSPEDAGVSAAAGDAPAVARCEVVLRAPRGAAAAAAANGAAGAAAAAPAPAVVGHQLGPAPFDTLLSVRRTGPPPPPPPTAPAAAAAAAAAAPASRMGTGNILAVIKDICEAAAARLDAESCSEMLALIQKIVLNALNDPGKRRVNMSGATFQSKVGRHPEGLQLLTALGFVEVAEEEGDAAAAAAAAPGGRPPAPAAEKRWLVLGAAAAAAKAGRPELERAAELARARKLLEQARGRGGQRPRVGSGAGGAGRPSAGRARARGNENSRTLEGLLISIGLEEYLFAMREAGFDDLDVLLDMSDQEFEVLAQECNLKPGHRIKMQKHLKKTRENQINQENRAALVQCQNEEYLKALEIDQAKEKAKTQRLLDKGNVQTQENAAGANKAEEGGGDEEEQERANETLEEKRARIAASYGQR